MARTIDAEAELRKFGIEFQVYGKFLRIRCPFHSDEQPSCDVSQEKQNFRCRACQVNGSLLTLLTRLSGKSAHEVLAGLDASQDRPIEASLVMRYHKRIWDAQKLLDELHKRGVSDATIKLFMLGEDEGRVTIPVSNFEGMFVNIRKYLPGATNEVKFKNLKGRGKPQIYPFSQLKYDRILMTGGEIKALAGIERLNQHGIGVVTITCGEGEWHAPFEDFFIGKHLWIGLDVDEVGRRAQEFRCARLQPVASWCGAIDWGLDKLKFPKGDLNDFVAEGGDLLQLLQDTPEWEGKIIVPAGTPELAEAEEIPIKDATNARMSGKRFKSRVSVTAVSREAYFIPKAVVPKCDRAQTHCPQCPVFASKKDTEFTVPVESTGILAMMDMREDQLSEEIRKALGIPSCTSVSFDEQSRYKVDVSQVQRAINLTQQDSDKTAVPAILVDQDIELNETYEVVGRIVPHPKTQQCFGIISGSRAVADALAGFKLSEPEELARFRPNKWTPQSIDDVLDPIYHELAHNVTKIYERKSMHQLVDLVYHSVLAIRVGQQVQKGVVEALLLGDSGQGKTWVAQYLKEFYELGERVDCKNATIAGIMGGCEQIAGTWFVQWGIIPQQDRKLVILEELKGMKPEVFAKMTDMRSSGIAEIPKIVRRKAQARTRILAISNARKNGVLSSNYSYGVNALSELVGSAEDLRRFDTCMIVDRRDIDAKLLNQVRENVPSTLTGNLCRKLVLWCWTRTVDQIQISKETIQTLMHHSDKLCDEFTDTIPILDRGSTRFKLLRLATALAGRTFSTDDFETMVVRPCHVEWITEFLRREYSKPTNGYLEVSKRAKKQETIVDELEVRSQLQTSVHAERLVESMLGADLIEQQDICDWCGWDKDEAGILISKLVRNNALAREGRAYRKTSAFAVLLRKVTSEPEFFKRPDHAKATPEAYA